MQCVIVYQKCLKCTRYLLALERQSHPHSPGQVYLLRTTSSLVNKTWPFISTTTILFCSTLNISSAYHVLHSPRNRCLPCVSARPRGYLHRTPVALAVPERTPAEPAQGPPYPCHSPHQYSHNSLSQTCTFGLHLVEKIKEIRSQI